MDTEQKKYNIKQIIYKFLQENKIIIGFYLFLMLSYPLESVMIPHLYGRIIDATSKSNPSNIFKNTKLIVITVIVIWSITQSMYVGLDYSDSYLVPKIQSYIRENIIKNIIDTFKNNYTDLQINDIISKIIKLPFAIRDIHHQLRHYFISTNIIIVFIVMYIFYCNKKLGFVSLTGVLILLILTIGTVKKCTDISTKKDMYHNKLHEEIGDVLNNMIPIYSSNTSDKEFKRLRNIQDTLDTEYTGGILCSARLRILFSIFNIILFISINGYAFYLYSTKQIKLGTLVSILIVVLYLLNQIGEMRGEMRDMMFNIGIIKESQKYLNTLFSKNKANNINDSKNNGINIKNGEIQFNNVSFKYEGTNDYIFNNLNVIILPEQTVALTGINGSGKSTFTKLIMKYLSHQKGDIFIDRINTKDIDTNKLRTKISYLPQNPKLFNRSVFENITYGTNNISHEDVNKLIKQLKVEHVFSSLEKGLDTSAGKNGNSLSGGQRQIVFLLRCLLRQDKVIILDEPTSALDTQNKKLVMKVLKYVIQKKTALIITHDPDIYKITNRIIKFHKGKIAYDKTK